MFDNLKILFHQGRQYIPDLTNAKIPGIFRGRPVISMENVNEETLEELCPTNAITSNPLCIDLGKCTFCGECALAFPRKIKFTNDFKISSNERERLIISEGADSPISVNPEQRSEEIHRYFGSSLKLRQV